MLTARAMFVNLAENGGTSTNDPRHPLRLLPLLPSGPGGVYNALLRGANGGTILANRYRVDSSVCKSRILTDLDEIASPLRKDLRLTLANTFSYRHFPSVLLLPGNPS